MSKQIILEADYKPSDDEPFMNDRQREYFRGKLLAWKDEILREAKETLVTLQSESENHPDIADRASSETDRAIELRARDRLQTERSRRFMALARSLAENEDESAIMTMLLDEYYQNSLHAPAPQPEGTPTPIQREPAHRRASQGSRSRRRR